MSGLPWFKCYPRDFNDGMVGLTMEERGAYVTILNLIYAKGAPIDDDPSYFRALLWCSPKSWVKVRAALIVKRKLFEVTYNGAPCLMNKRAAEEIAGAEEKSEKFSEAGRRGAEKANARHSKNNDLGSARPQPGTSDTDTDPEADSEVSEPRGSSTSPRATSLSISKTFAEFWLAYPRKVGKGAARKAYCSALKKIDGPDPPATLLAALARVKPTWTDPQFIPHPATWLNQERWEDGEAVQALAEQTRTPAEQADYDAKLIAYMDRMTQTQDRRHG